MPPEAYPYLLGSLALIVASTLSLYNAEDDTRVKAFIIAECSVGLRLSVGLWLIVELAYAATAPLQ